MDLKEIKTICKKNNYKFKFFGKNPRLLLIGEQHEIESHFRSQVKIIEKTLPNAVLHEFYDIEYDFSSATKEWGESPVLYELDYFFDISKKLKFDFLPGDAPKRHRDNLKNSLEGCISHNLNWPKELRGKRAFEDNIAYAAYYARLIVEPIMGMILREALNNYDGDVIGIYGDYHLRNSSQIYSVLNLEFPPLSGKPKVFLSDESLKKIDYAIIRQSPS